MADFSMMPEGIHYQQVAEVESEQMEEETELPHENAS